MEYIKDFNELYAKGRDIQELGKHLGFILASTDFNSEKLNNHMTTFFINLYHFMENNFTAATTGRPNHVPIALHCLHILEKMVKNPRARRSFTSRFDFLPLLTIILHNFPNEQATILRLLLKITYGIEMNRHETYLDSLLEQLVEIVHDEKDEESVLALSVLLNLCSKSGPARILLQEITKFSSLFSKAEPYKFLFAKLRLIFTTFDYQSFFKLGVEEVTKAFDRYDTAHLRQVVGLLVDNSISETGLQIDAVEVKKLLDGVCDRLDMNDELSEELEAEKSCCMALFCKLLKFLLQLHITNTDVLNQIVEMAVNWSQDVVAGPVACDVLVKIIYLVREDGLDCDIQRIINHLPTLIENLFGRKDMAIVSVQVISALINEQYSSPVLPSAPKAKTFSKMIKLLIQTQEPTDEDIRLFIHTLHLLQKLSNKATTEYYPTFHELIKEQRTAFFLASALTMKQRDVCLATFALIKDKEISEDALASQYVVSELQQSTKSCINRPIYRPPPTMKPSAKHEEKLDLILQHIDAAKAGNRDLTVQEMIVVYQQKNLRLNSRTESLERHIIALETQIRDLRHQQAHLDAESESMSVINESHILQLEKLEKEREILQKELATMHDLVKNLQPSLNKKKTLLAAMQQELNTKDIMLEQLKQQLEGIHEKFKVLQDSNELLNKQLEEYRLNLKRYEEKVKKTEAKLAEREEVIQKSTKRAREIEKENVTLNRLVKEMEKQVQEKDLKMQQCQTELQESEQLRQMVLNIVNKKQKK